MVEKGARHLAFLSRSGTNRPEAVSIVEELVAAGADPEVIQCNVADRKALASAVEELTAKRKVKGVIHAAMVEGVSSQRSLDQKSGSAYSIYPGCAFRKFHMVPSTEGP